MNTRAPTGERGAQSDSSPLGQQIDEHCNLLAGGMFWRIVSWDEPILGLKNEVFIRSMDLSAMRYEDYCNDALQKLKESYPKSFLPKEKIQ